MKTLRNFLALGFALILSNMTLVSAGTPGGKITPTPLTTVIRYQVQVHAPSDKSICNIYQVELLNAGGQQVAPAQIYIPGTTIYTFYERGPVKAPRVARMILAPIGKEGGRHYICDNDYFIDPVVQTGPFEGGQTYLFDLYPEILGTR